MAGNYIPQNDADFHQWQTIFVAYVLDNTEALKLTEEQIGRLESLSLEWNAAYPEAASLKDAWQAGVKRKNDAQDELEGLIRALVRQFQADPDMTDERRTAMNIPVRDDVHTPSGDVTTRPILHVDGNQRLQSLIRVFDESTPNSRKRPDNASGFELRAKVGGEAPAGPDDFNLPLGYEPRSPHLEEWDDDQGGQKAWIIGRWIAKNGNPGPWSETVMTTIAA
ncbi:hypothetical protein JXA32_11245 [Candidatus Sumerlaeota bacterium]|nr:hypothetical protein [Candidatus Sumerlaeota bacterium]